MTQAAHPTLARTLAPAHSLTRDLLLIAGGAALLSLLAQAEIPLKPVPVTLQTLGVLLLGAALGWKRGFAALALYLALGAAGLPVFAGGAGSIAKFAGPTGGYLLSYPFAAALVGYLVERFGLDRKFLGRGIVRTMMITPFLIVPVAAALLWKHALYNPEYGLFNGLLTTVFGDNAPQPDWITNNPLWAIIVALVWQWTPFMMLILLAGLQSRPLDVVEAARIDGASSWQIFRHMTLPHLRQYIELSGLLGAIYVVQNFDHVFTITGGASGSANLPFYIYQTFYTALDYGRASAAGVITVLGTLIIALLALRTVFSMFKEESR